MSNTQVNWNEIREDIDALAVSPDGRIIAAFKQEADKLLIGTVKGRLYPTRRANKIADYPLENLKTPTGKLVYRPTKSGIEVKEDGYYLLRHFEDGGLSVEQVHNGELCCNGEYYPFSSIHLHWIADKPLDLEKVKYITENFEVFID